jgi:hypothetical protein
MKKKENEWKGVLIDDKFPEIFKKEISLDNEEKLTWFNKNIEQNVWFEKEIGKNKLKPY